MLMLGLFLWALIPRLGILWISDKEPRFDENAYLEIAVNLVERGEYAGDYDVQRYGLQQARPPLLPYLLAALRAIGFASVSSLRVTLALLSASIVLAIYGLARGLNLPRSNSALCAMAISWHPMLCYYAGRLLTEALFALLIVGFLAAVGTYLRKADRGWLLLAGGALGLAALCRPTILPFIPCVAVIWFLFSPRSRRRHVLWPLLVAVLVLVPWELRLFREYKTFIPISTGSGLNFWYVNNPYMGDRPAVIERPPELVAHLSTLTEPQRDRHYRNLALEWAGSHPRQFWRMRGQSFLAFWRIAPADFWSTEYGLSGSNGWTGAIPFAKALWFTALWLLLLCMLTAIPNLWRKHRLLLALAIGMLGYFSVVHSFVISYARYRYPLDPAWMTLGVFGLYQLAQNFRKRNRAHQAPLGAPERNSHE